MPAISLYKISQYSYVQSQHRPLASGGDKLNVSTIKVNGISVSCGVNVTENWTCVDSLVSISCC